MQHDLPITLQTIGDLPIPVDDGDTDPAFLTGFCNLVRLFTRIDGPLLQAPHLSTCPTYSRDKITDIQASLQTGATRDPIIDEVQRVDIWITLAWLSSLLWQYSASHFMLTSDSSNVFFSPSYPFIVARNFLSLVCGASLDSVRPHGYGMVRFPTRILRAVLTRNVGNQTISTGKLVNRCPGIRPILI